MSQNQRGEPPTSPSSPSHDFTTPVELPCILDPQAVLKSSILLFVVSFFFFGLIGAIVLGLALDAGGVVAYTCGAIVGAIVVALMYTSMKKRLERTYGELQRLQLSPQGIRRTDGTITTEMPWENINRLQVTNYALQTARTSGAGVAGGLTNAPIDVGQNRVSHGIVGRSTLYPLPGAVRMQLRQHDINAGSRNLRRGKPVEAEEALIFPAEFENNWEQGLVGAWLRPLPPRTAVLGHPPPRLRPSSPSPTSESQLAPPAFSIGSPQGLDLQVSPHGNRRRC